MSAAVLVFLLFLCSGASGLIYQVIWVREFGNVFGNTVYSTSLVVAIFMLGLGVGSYGLGAWADRKYAVARRSILSAYGYVELIVAALGLTIAMLLPRLSAVVAALSAYQAGAHGWFVLTPFSYVIRALIAIVLLTPITVLMGGTLTLLIRHLVRDDVETRGRWTIAALYGVNTAGAAAGAFLTDFALVPAVGLFRTELVAVALNLVAGTGALLLARHAASAVVEHPRRGARSLRSGGAVRNGAARSVRLQPEVQPEALSSAVTLTSIALALSGFAALGLEILWFRHFTLLLGGFRAVFSLLMTVVLVGIGLGSFVGGAIARRTSRPAQALIVVQAALIVTALAGLAVPSLPALESQGRALVQNFALLSPFSRVLRELWFNLRPIVVEAGIPSLLMGCMYPLANAVIQHVEGAVGRRAGALYLANTAGAVCGSLVTGFLLLPMVGIQGSATWLAVAAAFAMVPLYFAAEGQRFRAPALAGGAVAAAAIAVWLAVPSDFILERSFASRAANERVVEMSEGINEIIAVTEMAGRGRALFTNGHAMSSTAILDQRYMRALADIPLLTMDRAGARVLVIGFGVGNTTAAAALNPTVRHIDVADLSRHVLEHGSYFAEANHDVLNDARVAVYVNDGRQHLEMQPPGTYDLVTLEPPPIAQAGVAALYSREFYTIVRSRLAGGGYISQWLPAYQVPPDVSLAMVRAFVDVFPQSVLLSGTQGELILLGTTASRIEIDPDRLASALARAPAVEADLRRVDLARPVELVGTFVSAAPTMTRATSDVRPATDDRPVQEYGVHSILGSIGAGIPGSLFNLAEVAAWCPRCYNGNQPAPAVAGLDTYMALMNIAYKTPLTDVARAAAARGPNRSVLGSAYLGAVLPENADVHAVVGLARLREGHAAEAVAELGDALRDDPNSPAANRNLGVALLSMGRPDAIDYLTRAVQLDPEDGDAQRELGSALVNSGRFADGVDHLRMALGLGVTSAAAENDFGVALASTGRVGEALEHFERAVALKPDFKEARQNLASARQVTGTRPH